MSKDGTAGVGRISRRAVMAGAAAVSSVSLARGAGAQPPGRRGPTAGRAIVFTHVSVLIGDKVQDDVALAVQGDRIAAIGTSEALLATYPGAEAYDGRGRLILPGLVNCHAHLAATLQRGFNEDFGFPNSARLKVQPASLLSADERALMVQIGVLEAIKTGTTTLVENSGGIAPYAAGLAASGLRMVFAESIRDTENVSGPMSPEGLAASVRPVFSAALREEGMARIAALHARWHGQDNGRISVMPAAALAETSSPELLRDVRAFADKNGLSYTIHLSQSVAEVDFMKKWHGMSPPAFLDRAGFLGPRLFAAHCRYMDDGDIALMGRTRSFVTHQANMAACRGVIPPIPALRAAGAQICLGTDNNTNDVFSVMRTALLTERIQRNDAFPGLLPQPENMIEDAVAGGARALGFEGMTGAIAVGRKADLIIVNTLRAHLVPCGRIVSALIHNGQPSDIEASMVDGRFIMRDRKVLTMDEPAMIAEADKVGRRIWNLVRAAGPIAIPGRPNA